MPILFAATLWAMAVSAGGGGAEAAPAWSPDGRWLAYVQAAVPAEEALRADWLYRARAGATGDEGGGRRSFAIWSVHAASGTSVLLHRGEGETTSPSWRPDGQALLYAEIAKAGEGAGSGRDLVVVVQDAPDHRKAIARRPIPATAGDEAVGRWGGSSPAWSPDGLEVAIPEIEPAGLSFYRVESGALLRTFAGASQASWSADGRWVAFYRGGDAPGLYVVDSGLGEPRKLVTLDRVEALPPPIWERDGRSLLVVRAATDRPRGMPLGAAPDLVIARVGLDAAPPAIVHEMAHPPIGRIEALRRVSMTADAQGESLFYSVQVDDQPPRITWLLRGRDEIYKQVPSVDDSVAIGALAIDPGNRRLAARYGGSQPDAPLAVLELDRMTRKPLVPDEASRFAWLGHLTGALSDATAPRRRADHAGRPPGQWQRRRGRIPGEVPGLAGLTTPNVERATVLPMPAELDPNLELAGRLDRIAQVGLDVCRPPLGPDPTGILACRLAEARLAFSYLNARPSGENYREARRALEDVATSAISADERERLTCVRVQIDLAEGERERARLGLEDLVRVRGPAASAVMEVPGGRPVLSEVADPLSGWISLLAAAIRRPEGIAGDVAAAVGEGPPMPLIPGAEPSAATAAPSSESKSRSAFRPVFPER